MRRPIDQLAHVAKKLGLVVTEVYEHDWDIDFLACDESLLLLDESKIHSTSFSVVSRDYLTIANLNFHPRVDYSNEEQAFKDSVQQLMKLKESIR